MYLYVAYARFVTGEPIVLGAFSRLDLAQYACGLTLVETMPGAWDVVDDGVFYAIRRVELDRMPPGAG